LSSTVRGPVLNPRSLLLVAAAMALHFAQVTAQERKAGPPRLSAQQASDLAASAFKKSGKSLTHFREGKPDFSADTHIWMVFFIQSTPPFITDGDMMVVVNDRSGNACVQQAMLPPAPCP